MFAFALPITFVCGWLYGKNIFICRTLCVKRTSCYQPANELQDACSQAVDMVCSHCLFSGVETSLEQAVNDLLQSSCDYIRLVTRFFIQD